LNPALAGMISALAELNPAERRFLSDKL